MERKRNFTVLLSEAERQLLEDVAKFDARRPGDMLRVCLREAALKRGLLDAWLPNRPGVKQAA
jgi:hypothetical protein